MFSFPFAPEDRKSTLYIHLLLPNHPALKLSYFFYNYFLELKELICGVGLKLSQGHVAAGRSRHKASLLPAMFPIPPPSLLLPMSSQWKRPSPLSSPEKLGRGWQLVLTPLPNLVLSPCILL